MRRWLFVAALTSVILVFAGACAGDAGGDAPDGGDGGPDAALGDGSLPDAGEEPSDGGAPDAGPPDGAAPDAAGDVGAGADAAALAPLDPVTAQSLQALLDEYLAFSGDPGVTFAVRTGEGRWWAGAAGVADLRTGAAMTADAGFRVGSNTKTVLATVVLQLVEEGRVGLDESLTTYLTSWPQWDDITVRHLLQMQSGLPDYLNQAELMAQYALDPATRLEPEELVDHIVDDEPLFAPGEGCRYSNTNYVLLGLIVEAVTGRAVEQELHDRVVAPLGLTNTWLDTTGEERPTLAHGYMDLEIVSAVFGVPFELVALLPAEAFIGDYTLDVTYVFHPSLSWAAGALVSTVADMTVFMRALLRGELLGPAALAEMQRVADCSILDSPASYGLGLARHETAYGTAWGHGGLNFGYQAASHHLPEWDLTFSHMHDFLPEQSWVLESEALALLVEGVAAPLVACRPPEGLFATDGEPYLLARVKGIVNPDGSAQPLPALAHLEQVTGEDAVPLYGLSTTVTRKAQAVGARVEISSIAPAHEAGVAYHMAILNVAPGLVAGLQDGAPHTLTPQEIAQAIGLVAAVETDPATQEAVRLCFTAVPDAARASRVAGCGAAGFSGAVGDQLRLFAALALTTDPTRVEETLTAFRLPSCLCRTPPAGWADCP